MMTNEKEKVYRGMLADKDVEIDGLRKELADYQRRSYSLQTECDSVTKDIIELTHQNELLTQENLALKERLVKLDNMVTGLIDDRDDLESLLDYYQNKEKEEKEEK